MPHIRQIETTAFRLPLKSALRWGAHSSLTHAEHSLLKVTLTDGTVGLGEALSRPTIYGETPQSISGAISYLARSLEGLDVEDEVGIARVLKTLTFNHTAKGGLDMALWDARFRSRGQNLFDHFSGPHKQIKVSYILGISSLNDMLEEARTVYAQGVRTLKVKVGRDYAKDLELVRILRGELPDLELYADSNETLSIESAPRVLEAMRDAGLLWVEEPLPVHQIRARAELRKLEILPLIADDSCFSLSNLERELDFDTLDILNLKTARTGFSESLKMLELAKQAGKSVMIGSQAGSLLSTRLSALFASLEGVDKASELSFFLKLEGDIAAPNPVLREGFLTLEDLRGVELDRVALERFSTV
jgi:L-Ala-D/L-Glu epimerase